MDDWKDLTLIKRLALNGWSKYKSWSKGQDGKRELIALNKFDWDEVTKHLDKTR